ncbi:Rv3212 family protein [Mycobacterium sp. NPDC003323]
MIRPERRTRGDLIAAGVIALAVAVVAALIWWTSDARATISRPAAGPVPTLTPATQVPDRLQQLWTAPSAETTQPLVVSGALVTGNGRTVTGRDPVSGDQLWSYERDLELCGVTSAYQYAVAVYPDSRGCGQVSTIDAGTGKRGPARTAYADAEVKLSTDGTVVLSYGDSRLELWRSDMVRMLSWGALDARVKPDVPVSPLCRLVSAQASSAAVSIMESCPQQTEMRLTLLRVSDEEDVPEVKYEQQPGVSVDADARVIAVSDTTTAVYLPTPKPVVNIVDDTGNVTASIPLERAPSPHAAASRAGDLITWWTGDSVLVFDAEGLRYKYTVSPAPGGAPVGPATVMAGRLLVPVTDGYDVFDTETGTGITHIGIAREPADTPVVPAVAGSTIVEQRGDTVVALAAP